MERSERTPRYDGRRRLMLGASLALFATTLAIAISRENQNHKPASPKKEYVTYRYVPDFTDSFKDSKGQTVYYHESGALLEEVHEPNGQVEYILDRRNITAAQAQTIENQGVLQPSTETH